MPKLVKLFLISSFITSWKTSHLPAFSCSAVTKDDCTQVSEKDVKRSQVNIILVVLISASQGLIMTFTFKGKVLFE